MKEWWWFSSFKCSHFIWLSYVWLCVCCPSFVAETGSSFFFLLQLGPNSGGSLSIHTRIIIHFKFDSTFSPKRKQTPWTKEREKERNIKRNFCFYVCVCVSRVGHSNSFLQKKVFLLFLSLSLCASLQFVMTSCCCCTEPCVWYKKQNKKTWKEEDAVKKKKKKGG